MYKHSTLRKISAVLVSVLILATVLLAACTTGGTEYKSDLKLPEQNTANGDGESNGGIAVGYGEYVYYVNGYVSDATAVNEYNGHVKKGDVVRIKKTDLDGAIAINDLDRSSSEITSLIADYVSEKPAEDKQAAGERKVELVVPQIFFTASTSTSTAGLYIYNKKLYVTTTNYRSITGGGNRKTSQLILCRYDLDGKNEEVLYTMESNSLTTCLSRVGENVYLMYVENDNLYCVDVTSANGKANVVAESVSSVSYEVKAGMAYFLNSDGNICSYVAGNAEADVLTEKTDTETYKIISANKGYVYFTKTDSVNSQLDGKTLFNVIKGTAPAVVLSTIPSSYYGWNNSVVYTGVPFDSTPSIYGIWISKDATASSTDTVLDPMTNDKSITFNKLEGDTLYYTLDGTMYSVDLASEGFETTAIVRSVSSTSGWAAPDVVGNYVFYFSSTNVYVERYNAETNTNKTDNGKDTKTNITSTAVEQ